MTCGDLYVHLLLARHTQIAKRLRSSHILKHLFRKNEIRAVSHRKCCRYSATGPMDNGRAQEDASISRAP